MALGGVGSGSPNVWTPPRTATPEPAVTPGNAWQPPRSATPEPPDPPPSGGYGYVPAPYFGYVESTLEAPLRKYEDLPTPKYGDEDGPRRPADPIPPPRQPDPVLPPRPSEPVAPPPPPVPVTPIGPLQPQAASENRLNLAGLLAPVRNIPVIMGRATASAAARAGGQGLRLQATASGLKGLRPTAGGVLWQALNPAGLLRSAGFSALVAFPIALIENLIGHAQGKTTANQFLAGTLADTAGYTAAGLGGTVVGALVGSIVPGLGTIVGMAAGALFSTLYDRLFRKQAHTAMLAQIAPGEVAQANPPALPNPLVAPGPAAQVPMAVAPAAPGLPAPPGTAFQFAPLPVR